MSVRRISPTGYEPLHVQIEVTWRCSWRCVHCYQDTHLAGGLTTKQYQQLFLDLRDAGTMHVIVTGGEPLVRPDIVNLLESARDAMLGITLYSNGHHLDARIAAQLKPLVGSVELSILAGDEQIHDTLTGVRGSWARVWTAVDSLLSNGIHCVVKTPLLRPALTSIRELASMLRVRGIEWNPDFDIVATYDGQQYPLEYRISNVERDALSVSVPELTGSDRPRRLGLCLAGRQFCFIDVDGNVYPCLSFKGNAERRVPAVRLGNVLDAPFREIWAQHPLLSQIRRSTMSSFSGCASCGSAAHTCMALNAAENADLFVSKCTSRNHVVVPGCG